MTATGNPLAVTKSLDVHPAARRCSGTCIEASDRTMHTAFPRSPATHSCSTGQRVRLKTPCQRPTDTGYKAAAMNRSNGRAPVASAWMNAASSQWTHFRMSLPGFSGYHAARKSWMDERVKVHLNPPHPSPLPEGEGVDVSLPTHSSISGVFCPPFPRSRSSSPYSG